MESWELAAQKMIAAVKPLPDQIATFDACALPEVVNVVASLELLPADGNYQLPLRAIANQLGCVEYRPTDFAACIIKLRDVMTDSTALVFASGKVVIVSARSAVHTIYVGQMLRLLLENVHCVMRETETGRHTLNTLGGRLTFNNCSVNNMVGNAFLGYRINLAVMRDAAPAACKWKPDSFPGLKCRLWIPQENRCVCKKPKCTCTVRLLMYKSGKLVIVGARNIDDVNSIFFRIRAMAPEYAESNTFVNAPFYQQMRTMMVPYHVVEEAQLAEEDAVDRVLQDCNTDTTPAAAIANAGTLTKNMAPPNEPPLLRLAKQDRVAEIRLSLQLNPSQVIHRNKNGKTIVDLVAEMPEHERGQSYQTILTLLRDTKEGQERNI